MRDTENVALGDLGTFVTFIGSPVLARSCAECRGR